MKDDAVGERPPRSPLRRRQLLFQRTLRLDRRGLERMNAKIEELIELLGEVEAENGDEFFTMTLHVAPDASRVPDPAA